MVGGRRIRRRLTTRSGGRKARAVIHMTAKLAASATASRQDRLTSSICAAGSVAMVTSQAHSMGRPRAACSVSVARSAACFMMSALLASTAAPRLSGASGEAGADVGWAAGAPVGAVDAGVADEEVADEEV